jgi:hypothetical protein
MSLVNWILRTSVGANQTSLALFMGDREVSAPGYKRVPIRWEPNGDSAKASIPLGGYTTEVSYDRYVIFAGEERLETVMEGSTVQLPSGWRWSWVTSIDFAGG